MQPLSGAIQCVMDQSQIDPVYRLKGRMLGSLMSNSRLPVGPVIGLQFNIPSGTRIPLEHGHASASARSS